MNNPTTFMRRSLSVLFVLLSLAAVSVPAQTTVFTYQGRFTDSTTAQPTNGTYDFQFALYDAASGGTLIASNITATTGVSVVNGTLTVQLDFGATAFSGADRYLEIRVKKTSESDYTSLAPRSQVTSAPYAVRALNALNIEATAGNSVIDSINNTATTTTIDSSKLSSDVVLLDPGATQNAATTDSSAALLDATGTITDTNNTILATSRFRFNFDGGILASGQQGFGNVPAEGSGTKMMWYPGKAAFRAGYIDGTQWDDANIGSYSNAFGLNARSSGDYGFSAGERVTAANSWSFAVGRYNTASGASSVALGEGASTNARQGSFVFADRSYLGNICDTGTLIGPYGLNNAGCSATSGVNTIVSAPNNNSFNVRASGGIFFYTNSTSTTGLRMSTLNSSNTMYGSFVWADRSSDAQVSPTVQNQTIFRSSNGFTIYTNSSLTAGVTVGAGAGAWSSVSDRNMKENFVPVNSRDILRKVLNLPITTWNYKSQDASIRHIGAMAQDFKAAFGVGESDKTISTIDPDGVAFAAIQGLNEELSEQTSILRAENDRLKEQLKQQETRLSGQQKQIDALKALICAANKDADICRQQ